jgi:hypothetical protein
VPIESFLESLLTDPQLLGAWGVLVLGSLTVLAWDLRTNNDGLGSLMQFVWGFTVLYSGPLGLAVYYYSGRAQIPRDGLWRRGFRSTCHCYAGCGTGEITGVVLAAGLLALPTGGVVAVTFALAYAFGMAFTVGPLLQDGMALTVAIRDAFYSESASIVVMEAVAIGTDVWLAGEAQMGEVLFWTSLVFSLSVGLLAAYPVNVALVHEGVKEGMMDPRETASA